MLSASSKYILGSGQHKLIQTTSTTAAAERGEASWYNPGAGACPVIVVPSGYDMVAALPKRFMTFDRWPAANCGRTVRVKNTANGKVVSVTVVDACGECEHGGTIYKHVRIDLSKGAFEKLTDGNSGLGRIPIEWYEQRTQTQSFRLLT